MMEGYPPCFVIGERSPLGNFLKRARGFLCNVKYYFSFDLGAQRNIFFLFWGVTLFEGGES